MTDRELMQQPQRTHWEGCEEVHPECKQPEQDESEAVRAAWMAGYTEGEREAIENHTHSQASRPRHQCDKETEMTDREDIPLGYTSAGGWREYHRDADGKAVTVRESNGDWYECTSDERGNVLKYRNSKDNWYEYTRDANGNVLTFKTSDGYWCECTRDSHGNVLTRRDSNGDWCEYTRDANGNVLTYWEGRKANREWVGLTEEDVRDVYSRTVEGVTVSEAVGFKAVARALEAKLKEKNNG